MGAKRYDDAVDALYGVPLQAFVAERKRIAGELRAGGDREGAAELAKLRRPTASAWAVNQLWRQERSLVDALFDAAARLRGGDLDATSEHRDALHELRARAAALLTREGHGAGNAVLERVTTTLSSLAAAGTFDPDPEGALTGDRDPTGFEAFAAAPRASKKKKSRAPITRERKIVDRSRRVKRDRAAEREAKARERAEEKAREREEARAAREEARARERRKAQRSRLRADLRASKTELAERAREADRAQAALARAQTEHHRLEARLRELDREDAA